MKLAHTLPSLAAASLFALPAAAELGDPVRLDNLDLEKLEGPDFADVNGDGKKDLLSGLYSGHLMFRENVGTAAEPKFAAATALQTGGGDIKLKHW